MAFLTLNGVDIPIADRGLTVSYTEIGQKGRAYDGTQRSTVRAVKREWKCKTSLLPYADSEFYRAIIQGLGERWTFASSDLFGVKGNNFAVTTPAPTFTVGGGPKSDNYITSEYPYGPALPNLYGISYSGTQTGPVSLAWFQKDQDNADANYNTHWNWFCYTATAGGALSLYWKHWSMGSPAAWSTGSTLSNCAPAFVWSGTGNLTIARPYVNLVTETTWVASHLYAAGSTVFPTSANGRVYKTTLGGTSAASQPTWPTNYGQTVVDGSVTWTCLGKTAAILAEPMQAPWQVGALSSSVQGPVTAYSMGVSNLPRLTLSGDVVDNVSTVSVVGSVDQASAIQFSSGGSWNDNGVALDFTLSEV
jgi:hypothetical protein